MYYSKSYKHCTNSWILVLQINIVCVPTLFVLNDRWGQIDGTVSLLQLKADLGKCLEISVQSLSRPISTILATCFPLVFALWNSVKCHNSLINLTSFNKIIFCFPLLICTKVCLSFLIIYSGFFTYTSIQKRWRKATRNTQGIKHTVVCSKVVSVSICPPFTSPQSSDGCCVFYTHLTWEVREEKIFPLLRINGLELEVFNVGPQEWFVNSCRGDRKKQKSH